MSNKTLQHLLDALLWDIYGKVSLRQQETESESKRSYLYSKEVGFHICPDCWKYPVEVLQGQTIESLTQISASLRLEIRVIGSYLTRALIKRDRRLRRQEMLCDVVTAYLQALSNKSAEARDMKFRLLPPSPPKIDPAKNLDAASSDFNQWLHAMKMVARLPGGMPPEFRRKLWLALADRYLQSKNVDWAKEQEKCFSEQWREDDEELGIQIVKDLHRTGSSLCSGPAGSLNQAKLKRVLLGYARWNPEVGYCQGFNMLGALILQVMDKSEEESMKVMIFLVEGVLPPGYFSGSLGGLQADMAVFREIMTSKLPRLAKHLQKLQGPIGEGSFEPPLTNVFTMQWFLTLFCTCLPINCVLRVWDLILIEGSDVLLRTALAIWSLLEGKILATKTADDYYCRMGTLSGELLNGHLIDSNGLIEKVVELGPIAELQKLREKHLYNIAPWQDRKGLKIFYSDDEPDSDEDSRLAVATVWGLRINRRGSASSSTTNKPTTDNKDRIALDISLLKKQYDRLRERQRQAHIILTAAVAKQGTGVVNPSPPIQMNQLLMGRNAIVTNRGRRIGPPQGAIPPARKLPASSAKPIKQTLAKPTRRGETLHWHDTEATKKRKNSITLKEASSSKRSSSGSDSSKSYVDVPTSSRSNVSEKASSVTSSRSRKKSESSSYSEESDANSSTSTSLCDDDDMDLISSSLEASPLRKFDTSPKASYQPTNQDEDDNVNEVPDIILMSLDKEDAEKKSDVPGNEKSASIENLTKYCELIDEDSSAECDRIGSNKLFGIGETNRADSATTNISTTLASTSASSTLNYASTLDMKPMSYLDVSTKSPLEITSTSQLSPIADISTYINLLTKNDETAFHDTDDSYDASEEGVTNEYFERVNLVERPKKLELFYSLNDRDNFLDRFKTASPESEKTYSPGNMTQKEEKGKDKKEIQQSEVIGTHEKSPLHQSPDVSPIDHFKIRSSDLASSNSPSPFSVTKHAIRHPLHHHIDREKSFSFDDATIVEKEEPRPTSCPEARADIVEGKCRSDRVLKIIEENSMILHRILKKHAIKSGEGAEEDGGNDSISNVVADVRIALQETVGSGPDLYEVIDNATLGNSKTEEKGCEPNNEKRLESETNVLPSNSEQIDTSYRVDQQKEPEKSRFSTIFDPMESPRKLDRDRSSSRPRSRTEIPLRYDDNIADRLASIKNTIKSIDSLCDDRNSYKRDKCQKYIDSLFEQKQQTTAPVIQISEPINDYNSNKDYTTNEFSSYTSRARYSRDLRRDISPRRRLDEDREEYESRARRDNLPTYSTNFKDNENSSVDPTHRNNNKSPIRWNNQNISDLKDFDGTTSPCAYNPNKIEIRHTTVTATMYDRYLYQKKERDAKTDKSPPSPIITKAYLDSLKPNSSFTGNRYARSAENSPTRDKASTIKQAGRQTPLATSPCDTRQDIQIRSCDNILMQLGTCSTLTTSTTAMQPSYSPLSSPPKSYQTSLITIEPYKGPLDRSDPKS
ncbi:uncharacterized protein LOC119658944 isoform X1 [Hermetia illucens]|uniref:uncharacterized protein LOC119658944 isoform X1 n=1 Tax=Hermetia illucens TaxID=343691 RepID=UPI0018CC1E1B|nr:uncharacterized protein LOC119658944 isoform X1 [Hermetia illucens]